jgi:hypothetical protein
MRCSPAFGLMCYTGDIFEMEDQRNWTDASFKTFCTRSACRIRWSGGDESANPYRWPSVTSGAASGSAAVEVAPLTFSVGSHSVARNAGPHRSALRTGDGQPRAAVGRE